MQPNLNELMVRELLKTLLEVTNEKRVLISLIVN